jgi:hypothetical protein
LLFHVVAFGPNGAKVNPFHGVPLGSLQDAGLYLGQPGDLMASRPNPAIYLDPAYWQELQRRNALLGNPANLDSYRQEKRVQYRPPELPPSPEGGKANPASELCQHQPGIRGVACLRRRRSSRYDRHGHA